jgi:hypothetical protein
VSLAVSVALQLAKHLQIHSSCLGTLLKKTSIVKIIMLEMLAEKDI